MKCALLINFLILLFCCGQKANAAHKCSTQTFSSTSQVKYHGLHDAPEITIQIVSNQAIAPLRTAIHFKNYFLPPVLITGSKISAKRLLPDVHALVKSIIFPQHYFW